MVTVLSVLGATAAACGALMVIGKFIWIIGRFFRKAGRVVNHLEEFPEFRDHVMHELSPNSGSSMRDEVSATKRMIEEHVNNADIHIVRGTD